MPLDTLLDRILNEGDVIKRAPIVFGAAVAFVAIVAFLFADFHYSGVIEEQGSTIERLKEDQQGTLDEDSRLRIKLGLSPAPTRYEEESNAELIKAALDYASKIDDLWGKQEAEESANTDKQMEAIRRIAPNPAIATSAQHEAEVIPLREEILSRLPKEAVNTMRSSPLDFYYDGALSTA